MSIAVKAATEIQCGKETTRGTAVTPARRLVMAGRVVNQREEEAFEDSDDGLLARTSRAPEFTKHWTELELRFPFDYQQILLALMSGMKGGVSGSGVGPDYSWAFAPATNADPNVDTFTLQYYESDFTNKIRKEAAYCFTTSFEITIGDSGVPEVSINMVGRKATAPTNTSLALPTLQPAAALLHKVYVDSTWAGLGTTQITGQIYGVRYRYETGIFPQYYLDGRSDLDFSTIHYRKRRAELEIDVAVDPNSGFVPTEETNRDNKTARFVQVEVVGPTLGASNYKLELDGAYYHAPDSLAEIGTDRDGNMVRRVHLLSKYDSTGAADVQATVVNDLASFG